MITDKGRSRFDWVDGLKAFAIIAILLNHFVEQYGAGPWFSNPSYDWPSFNERMSAIFPAGNVWILNAIRFLGWLGDMGPGVFILLSGFTLALSQLRNEKSILDFFSSRILRILPLYIAIHLIVLAFILVAYSPARYSVTSPLVILSFFGLRFTDTLFFFINPSWWFIWLIIQLYLFFPLLFKWLKSKNLVYFIGITLIITILSRLAGLLHLTYSNNLYFWMTGLFAGTRLFEFTLGMAFAKFISDKPDFRTMFKIKPVLLFLIFITIYLAGFVSSWTYIGSLISNILITIGLSGIFYGFYNLCSRLKPIKNGLLFIGRNSFSVFLIHQPFMQFANDKLHGTPKFISLIAIILLAFPVGFLLEKAVNILVEKFKTNNTGIEKFIAGKPGVFIIYSLTLLIIAINFVLPVFPYNISKISKAIALLDIMAISLHIGACFRVFKKIQPSEYPVFLIFIIIFYFILPPGWISLVSPALIMSILFYYGFKVILRPISALFVTFILIVVLFLCTEQYLRIREPLKHEKWGEFPAMRTDSNTVYSLIPNKTTHLKYNNYDYTIKTNSMGFTSPEIDLRKNDPKIFRILIVGDAFSMPEGMEYSYSYPSLLEQELQKSIEGRKIQVINGGVTGYGPNEVLAQVKYYIDTIKPDLIINEFFVNEFLEINLGANERYNDIGFNTKDIKQNHSLESSQLFFLYRNWLKKISGTEMNQYNYNNSLLFLYDKSSALYSDSVINKIDNYFSELKSLSDQKGAKLWLVYVPGQIEVSPAKYMSYYPHHVNLSDTSKFDFSSSHLIINSLCKKHSIKLLDTKEMLKNYADQPVYFEESWHWNKTGHKLIAEMLAKNVEKSLSNEIK